MPTNPSEPAIRLRYILFFLAVATGTAGAIIAIWAYTKFAQPYSLSVNIADIKDKPTAEEIKALVSKMSQIIILPTDELPEVLVISDLTQTRANPFFANANVGDYILIYKKARKVVLYNPTTNRIVNMGPYSGENESTSSAKPLELRPEASQSAPKTEAP